MLDHIHLMNKKFIINIIVYYVPRRIMRVITRRATMLAGDRSRGTISPASILASLIITRIVCIGTYSILCASGVELVYPLQLRVAQCCVLRYRGMKCKN